MAPKVMTFARICLAQLPPQASLILRTSCVSKEKKAHAKSEKEVMRDMRDACRGGYIASKLEIWENIH